VNDARPIGRAFFGGAETSLWCETPLRHGAGWIELVHSPLPDK
jgi:hypothetical protein